MNAFPDRRCEVPGCETGALVLLVLDHLVCLDHFHEYERFENLYGRRCMLLKGWLDKKAEVKP